MTLQRLFRMKSPCLLLCVAALLSTQGKSLKAQATTPENLSEKIQKLNEALARTQAQLEQSQREMDEMRRQLAALQQQIANANVPPPAASSQAATAVDDLRERQAMQETQIATQEQTKVETESKFPLKLTGLLLFNGFVNTKQVDMPATPTIALGGAGSTGASVRQTMLGLDARGPHLFGALSHADVRIDFDATQSLSSATVGANGYSSSYSGGSSLLRLRTAHATLDWARTQAFFSLDRPILNPDSPTSLTAMAEPALAWSGNLWAWNPQVGVTHDIALKGSTQLRVQAALIDPEDAPLLPSMPVNAAQLPSTATTNLSEQSRWPGSEFRIALMGSKPDTSAHFGLGGYFAPHRSSEGYKFNAWAVTADYRLPLPEHLELTGSAYRGQALGGLGAGGYKDYLAYVSPNYVYYEIPDDVGGWSQLKEKLNERLEFNAAVGVDELFAGQLRPYAGPYSAMYQNLARNRTVTGNVIYSPSAYLIFSLEYRHLESSPVVGPAATSNIIGLGAGYKF